jgi:hypothetical protein
LWAEGETSEVTRFLDDVRRRMAENIEEQREAEETPQGMTGFTIRG